MRQVRTQLGKAMGAEGGVQATVHAALWGGDGGNQRDRCLRPKQKWNLQNFFLYNQVRLVPFDLFETFLHTSRPTLVRAYA